MKHAVGLPNGHWLHSARPEDFVRAWAVARVLGMEFPVSGMVAWLEAMTPEYDGTPFYWQPYERRGSAVVVSMWARGAYSYMAYRSGGIPVSAVAPEDWYTGLLDSVPLQAFTPPVRTAFELAAEQTDPMGLEGESIVDLWSAVRRAQEKAELLANPKAIKRVTERLRADER